MSDEVSDWDEWESFDRAEDEGSDDDWDSREYVEREREEFERLWRETFEEVEKMSVEEWMKAMEKAGISVDDDEVPEDVVDRAMRLFGARYRVMWP
jgi:cell wall-associated NlpC family hydrolase